MSRSHAIENIWEKDQNTSAQKGNQWFQLHNKPRGFFHNVLWCQLPTIWRSKNREGSFENQDWVIHETDWRTSFKVSHTLQERKTIDPGQAFWYPLSSHPELGWGYTQESTVRNCSDLMRYLNSCVSLPWAAKAQNDIVVRHNDQHIRVPSLASNMEAFC